VSGLVPERVLDVVRQVYNTSGANGQALTGDKG
jgi:hypothetical protein